MSTFTPKIISRLSLVFLLTCFLVRYVFANEAITFIYRTYVEVTMSGFQSVPITLPGRWCCNYNSINQQKIKVLKRYAALNLVLRPFED